jgi:sorbitol-6-phosphate 2-dehydrogenase
MGERFTDKVVIVTGAARGLGAAIAQAFLDEGASVALADSDAVALDKTVHHLHEIAPTRVIPVQTDVSNEASVQRMIQAVLELYKRVDVLVSAEGAVRRAEVTEFNTDDWRRVIERNLVGYFICAKHAARALREHGGGAIVAVNCMLGRPAGAGDSALAASKAGGLGLTRALALELAPYNIRVNAVCPAELPDVLPGEHPSEHEGETAAATATVLFLASDDASYVTGQALTVGE